MANTPQPPVHYGFVRTAADIPKDYAEMQKAGLGGLVFNAEDPNFAHEYIAARNAGLPVGIWIPAKTEGGDASAYAQRMAELAQKYRPDILVPDIEFGGKGYPGSKEWDWNQKVASTFRALDPNQQIAVTVMPNQDDFNYGAWTKAGAQVWAQSYGANPKTDQVDPQEVYQRMIANGVPPELAQVVLAPGQDAHGVGNFDIYTVDDMTPEQRQQFSAMVSAGATPQQAVAAVQSGAAQSNAPTQTAAQHVPDAKNPAAIAYSRMKLQQLARLGYTPKDFGLEGMDPTAQYRAMSSILGANEAVSAGHAADYHVGATVPQTVAEKVNQLLHAALPQPSAPNDDPRAHGPSAPPVHTAAPAVQQRTPSAPVPASSSRIIPALSFGRPDPAAVRALIDIKRNPPGDLAQAEKRIGPMQTALQTATAVRFLRTLGGGAAVGGQEASPARTLAASWYTGRGGK